MELTEREKKLIQEFILHGWNTGVVRSKEAALEVITLEDKIKASINGNVSGATGEKGDGEKKTAS